MDKRVVSVARVSDPKQKDEGYSLEAQNKFLDSKILNEGWDNVKRYTFQETAFEKGDRKEFEKILKFIGDKKNKIDILLFDRLDRALRNDFDRTILLNLRKTHNVSVCFARENYSDDSTGRLQFRLMSDFAIYTSDNISQETKKGMSEKVSQGGYPGRAPYGYKNVTENGKQTIVVDPKQSHAVKRIFELYAIERLSMNAITERIYKEGYRYRSKSGRFPRTTIEGILKNRFYIGQFKWGSDVWHTGNHTPIIDRQMFDKVQSLLRGKMPQKYQAPYASMASCSHCGNMITGERKAKKLANGMIKTYDYYWCTGNQRITGHPQNRMNAEHFDNEMTKIIREISIGNSKVAKWFESLLKQHTGKQKEEGKQRRRQLQKEHDKLSLRMDSLMDMRLDDKLSEDNFEKQSNRIADQLTGITVQLDDITESTSDNYSIASKLLELSQTLTGKYIRAEPRVKRKFVELVCSNLVSDGVSLYPTYRYEFEMLRKVAENGNGVSNRIRTGGLLDHNQAL